LGCVAPKDNTAKEKSSYVLSMKNKMGRLKGRSRLYAYRLCGTIEMHISMTPYPCPLLIGYLSLKQGAGAKTGTDGRTFYLWYGKDLRKLFERLGFQLVGSSKSASLVNPKDIWLGYVLEKP